MHPSIARLLSRSASLINTNQAWPDPMEGDSFLGHALAPTKCERPSSSNMAGRFSSNNRRPSRNRRPGEQEQARASLRRFDRSTNSSTILLFVLSWYVGSTSMSHRSIDFPRSILSINHPAPPTHYTLHAFITPAAAPPPRSQRPPRPATCWPRSAPPGSWRRSSPPCRAATPGARW